MDKNISPYILHINDAIDSISTYIEGFDFKQFNTDYKTQDAVIRQLEIIGEAASNLNENFKSFTPEISWREITDFRNVLAHEYWNVDSKILWKAATIEIVDLKKALLTVIKKFRNK